MDTALHQAAKCVAAIRDRGTRVSGAEEWSGRNAVRAEGGIMDTALQKTRNV